MNKKENNKPLLQWHPAFYAGLQIEFEEEKDKLIYLVYAYACLYKADTPSIDEISADEITITFVISKFPKNLLAHLKDIRKYSIEKVENGVYYIKGDFFPIQIINTKELSDTTNLWLHNLRDDITEKNVIQKLLLEYRQHDKINLYSSVINIIATANKETFLEVTNMSKVLEEIFLEVHGERLEREKQQAIDEAVAEAVAEKDAYIKELETKLAKLNNQ